MKKHTAVGIHVFAGGFTEGVMRHPSFKVRAQLETFDLGKRTVEEKLKVPFIQVPSKTVYVDWPDFTGTLAYGNPRCTAFSCMTSNCTENGHGAFARQTVDILQLSEYAADRFDVVVFESVQQCFTTGRPLLDQIVAEIYAPRGYRIAHILLTAASFGNAQNRKRYFFVAYRDHLKFNIHPPAIEPYYSVLWDAIGHVDPGLATRAFKRDDYDDDPDSYVHLSENEWKIVPKLPNGWNLNTLAEFDYDSLPDAYKLTWDTRMSPIPFSLHCPGRINWFRPSPTLAGTSGRMIHPDAHRPLTVRELSLIMGWKHTPLGPHPVGQIAKGICPEVGTWLAEQVRACVEGDWGNDDWESSYDARACEWVGRDTTGQLEKIFKLTSYAGQLFDMRRYPIKTVQQHMFNIDPDTGRKIRPWHEVAARRLMTLRAVDTTTRTR